MSPPPIPPFYRIWFTIIDPLFTLLGIYSNIFTPTTILASYSPTFASPHASETMLLLHTAAAFLAGLLVLQTFLLRAKPTDATVWRAVQASTLMVDIGMLGAFTGALKAQGRMDVRVWRMEEWMNYGVTVGVSVIRSAFLLGVGGVGRTGKEKV